MPPASATPTLPRQGVQWKSGQNFSARRLPAPWLRIWAMPTTKPGPQVAFWVSGRFGFHLVLFCLTVYQAKASLGSQHTAEEHSVPDCDLCCALGARIKKNANAFFCSTHSAT